MAQKPRVKAPKQRTAAATSSGGQRRWLVVAVAAVGLALAVGAVAALPRVRRRRRRARRGRRSLEARGCGLHAPVVSRCLAPAHHERGSATQVVELLPADVWPALLHAGRVRLLLGARRARTSAAQPRARRRVHALRREDAAGHRRASPGDLRPRPARSRRRAASRAGRQDRPRRLDLARAGELPSSARASREVHRRRQGRVRGASSTRSAAAAPRARASTSCSPAEPRSPGAHSGRRGGGTGETRPP